MPPRKARATSSSQSPLESGNVCPDSKSSNPKRRRMGGEVDVNKDNKGRRSVRARVGRLKKLQEMPLDILYEIFVYLHPLDLLHLSWTTKALRATLMNRSFISIWKRSLTAVEGLPECPSDMTEAQWAYLVFCSRCHFCGTSSVKNIFWTCRVRCCSKCMDANFVDSSTLRIECSGLVCQVVGALPRAVITRGRHSKMLFLKSSYEVFKKERLELQDDEEAVKKLLEEKASVMEDRFTHAFLCQDWFDAAADARNEELIQMRKRRYEGILSRLRDLGWGRDLDGLHKPRKTYGIIPEEWLSEHPLVKKSQDLTEKIWKNIQPTLEVRMQEIRAKRLEHELSSKAVERQTILAELVTAYLDVHGTELIQPCAADYACMDAFRDILDLPASVSVNALTFTEVLLHMETLGDEWLVSVMLKLLDLLPNPGDSQQLLLATTLFRCTQCEEILSTVESIMHPCMTRRSAAGTTAPCYWLLDEGEPWNHGDKLRFCPEAHLAARRLVELCGLDPDDTIGPEMHNGNHIFDCLTCSNERGAIKMPFGPAIIHACLHGAVRLHNKDGGNS